MCHINYHINMLLKLNYALGRAYNQQWLYCMWIAVIWIEHSDFLYLMTESPISEKIYTFYWPGKIRWAKATNSSFIGLMFKAFNTIMKLQFQKVWWCWRLWMHRWLKLGSILGVSCCNPFWEVFWRCMERLQKYFLEYKSKALNPELPEGCDVINSWQM